MDYVLIVIKLLKKWHKFQNMLQPSLINNVDCGTVPVLLDDIDCKLKELASSLYNNTIYSLNFCINDSLFLDLLNYKRILTYKFCNPDYAQPFTVEMIASRVKILKYK
jgi:hypothetical protein